MYVKYQPQVLMYFLICIVLTKKNTEKASLKNSTIQLWIYSYRTFHKTLSVQWTTATTEAWEISSSR